LVRMCAVIQCELLTRSLLASHDAHSHPTPAPCRPGTRRCRPDWHRCTAARAAAGPPAACLVRRTPAHLTARAATCRYRPWA
jgi:hypothetical protein